MQYTTNNDGKSDKESKQQHKEKLRRQMIFFPYPITYRNSNTSRNYNMNANPALKIKYQQMPYPKEL